MTGRRNRRDRSLSNSDDTPRLLHGTNTTSVTMASFPNIDDANIRPSAKQSQPPHTERILNAPLGNYPVSLGNCLFPLLCAPRIAPSYTCSLSRHFIAASPSRSEHRHWHGHAVYSSESVSPFPRRQRGGPTQRRRRLSTLLRHCGVVLRLGLEPRHSGLANPWSTRHKPALQLQQRDPRRTRDSTSSATETLLQTVFAGQWRGGTPRRTPAATSHLRTMAGTAQ